MNHTTPLERIILRTQETPIQRVIRACPEEELDFWKVELCALGVEMAVKLHGIKDQTAVRMAVEDALNLCSLGLLLQSEVPDQWEAIFRRDGVLGAIRHVTRVAKEISEREIPKSFQSSLGKRSQIDDNQLSLTPRDVLRRITSTARDKTLEAALSNLQYLRKQAEIARNETRLANRILETEAGWATTQDLPEAVQIDEFFLVAIPRVVGIPRKDIPNLKSVINAPDPDNNNFQEKMVVRSKERTLTKARHVFDKWVLSLPEGERLLLGPDKSGRDWFDRNIQIKPS